MEHAKQESQKQLNPMPPNMISSGRSNPTFSYTGNTIYLKGRIQAMQSTQINSIRQISITVYGDKVQQINYFCIVLTAVFGVLLIFPLFFTCCDWWTRMASSAYEINVMDYQSLQKLFKSPLLTSFKISVVDNCFNSDKAKVLYDMLSKSNVKYFTFINLAKSFNFHENQYDDFGVNMSPIKTLSMNSQIKWNKQVV